MNKLLLLSLGFLVLSSCEKVIFGIDFENEPEDNFEALWSEFDQMYGLFKVRNVDWDSVYQVFRPRVTPTTSEAELYTVMTDMLKVLDDGHVALLPAGSDLPQYVGGPAGRIDTINDFHLDVVKNHYLREAREDEPFVYGYLTDEIGYLYVEYFPDEKPIDRAMPAIIDYFRDATGLVVDIRGEYGGEDRGGQALAAYFADQRRLYMTTSIKDGPEPDDFTTPEEWHIAPASATFNGPIALLTHRPTISARETYALAMRVLPRVTSLGDTTAGAFSNAINRELPNGWLYSLSIGDWRAADGTSYEGRGLPPDLLIQNRREDLLNGQDEVLEAAIDLLEP